MDSTSLEGVSVVVSIIAAAISAVGAAVVAWQAVQTRQSTRAAIEAVDVARAELSQGEALRDDALKAHIDAEMPRVTVTAYLHAEVLDPAEPPASIFLDDRKKDRLTQKEYVLPRDSSKLLQAKGTVTVINDGPRFMEARYRSDSDPSTRPLDLAVPPGESRTVEVSRTETVERWVDLARWAQGDTSIEGPHEDVIFSMSYRFPGWVGAVEEHRVVMGGTAVEPVEGNASAWRPAQLNSSRQDHVSPASLVLQPFERHYFRNRPGDDVMGWF
ncbi:hypothetical protein [Microbacterium sp. AG157]|uniref:hypothetical protein n=1 Tax=Microbacterium sp. AG157 TaxID=2183993 RepID=UPI000E2777A7|nr:hypothetical protein [Microbacterium sp. AG157]